MRRTWSGELASFRALIFLALLILHVLLLRLPWTHELPARVSAPAVQLIVVDSQPVAPWSTTDLLSPVLIAPPPLVPSPPSGPVEENATGPAPLLPHINWAEEATRAAEEGVARAQQESSRSFGGAGEPGSIEVLPREIPVEDFPWSVTGNGQGSVAVVRPPGEMPYLLLWNRCRISVLLTAIIGCSIGPLAPARSDLFEDMDNPDRPRDSVPAR